MPTPLSPRFDPEAPQHNDQWAKLWEEQVTPWDRSEPSPALVELLEAQADLFQCKDVEPTLKKRVLVPGCGRGYDVGLFSRTLDAKQFDQVIGLEVSPGAVEAAKSHLNENSGKIAAHVVLGDFFDKMDTSLQEPFAIIYDYTFLCAMPPHRRSAWAQRMAELTAPGSLLVTLQHPLDEHEGGPPFSLTSALYDELLLGAFDKVYFERPTKSFKLETSKLDMIAVFKKH
ncbi:S-adenosyl-L-methionine-dependent methyltransferase [Protomyces lactucae-debilis]|uniref:S-adenosyl-L-methionine-dependent methyltransferase n=1 Tax=Protomyces lactucae-debilis TaxID=2754530 RepID=A0A1Y2FI18_PROLT|nr:S-adenosyl-L-methionine-dependent methyltransferase [Protomyces lactucae-debilis]ORY83608.1 S-adenosyl-L-methionine-dependent methyltransferase [Protomyces lactucae-debilis]